jgi:hypothetical protein
VLHGATIYIYSCAPYWIAIIRLAIMVLVRVLYFVFCVVNYSNNGFSLCFAFC